MRVSSSQRNRAGHVRFLCQARASQALCPGLAALAEGVLRCAPFPDEGVKHREAKGLACPANTPRAARFRPSAVLPTRLLRRKNEPRGWAGRQWPRKGPSCSAWTLGDGRRGHPTTPTADNETGEQTSSRASPGAHGPPCAAVWTTKPHPPVTEPLGLGAGLRRPRGQVAARVGQRSPDHVPIRRAVRPVTSLPAGGSLKGEPRERGVTACEPITAHGTSM